VDDAPEDLVGVVGLDRQAEQVGRLDLVAIGRGRLVPGRNVFKRHPGLRGGRVADDEATGLVRVLGTGLRSDRLADGWRHENGRWPGVVGHHQFTPPSSASSISSRLVEKVPADRYFQPPSGRSATIVPDSISDATRAAATMTAPHDGPAKIPSRKTSSRRAAIASRFETRYFASMNDGSRISGMKPSSRDRRPWTSSPGSGSAAMTRTPSLCSRR